MPANHLNPRLAAGVLLGLVVILGLIISPASASTILDEEPIIYEDTGGTLKYNVVSTFTSHSFNRIRLESVESRPLMPYIAITVSKAQFVNTLPAEGEHHITYTAMGQTKPATMYVEYSKDYFGTITHARYLIFFDDWDTTGYTGPQYITLSEPLWSGGASTENTDTSSLACVAASSSTRRPGAEFTITVVSVDEWKNRLLVTDNILNSYQVDLQRVYDGATYPSEITILKEGSTVFYEASPSDFSTVYLQSEIDEIKIQTGSDIFHWPLEPAGSDSPATATVSVYVVDSQTGYLLQGTDTRIQMMNASAEWEEVFNQTNFAGSAKIPLEKTTDPDGIPYYWIQSTRAGYQQVPETQIFSVYGDRQVIVEMEPTGAPPVDPGNAFVEFYVFDWLHNPINHVAVKIGDEYLYTNRQGWVQYELPKNTTYTYTLTAPDYITTTGSVVVGADPRYRVDVEMQVGTVPTNTPTLAPGETPGATPTPDHRTNEQKGQAVIDMIADNAEGIGALALLCLLMGLLKLLAEW